MMKLRKYVISKKKPKNVKIIKNKSDKIFRIYDLIQILYDRFAFT